MYAGPQSGRPLGEINWLDPVDCGRGIQRMWEQRYLKDPLELRTRRNLAFYAGRQYVELDDKTQKLIVPRHLKKVQDLLLYNVIKPLLNQKIAKTIPSDGVWSTSSYTTDEVDQIVSRFSNDLLGWYYVHGLKLPLKLEELMRWYHCSPVAWVQPVWNPVAGEIIETTLDDFYRDAEAVPEGAPPELAAEIEAANNARRGEDLDEFRRMSGFRGGMDLDPADQPPLVQYTGDVDVRVRSIFDVMWYPFCVKQWDHVHAYLVSEVLAPEEVAHRYNLSLREVEKYRDAAAQSDYASRAASGFHTGYQHPFNNGNVTPIDIGSGVLVHQFQADATIARPSRENPTGGVVAVMLGSGPEAISVSPGFDNPLNRLSLYPIVEDPDVVWAWGGCVVDDAIGPQEDINDAKTQARRYRRAKVQPKIAFEKGSIDPRSLEDEKRSVEVKVATATWPKPIVQPDDHFDTDSATAFNMQYLHDCFAVPDVSLGRTDTTDAKSGRAIIQLQQEAQERNKSTGKKLNHLMSDVGTHILSLLQAFAVDERLTAIVGKNNDVELKVWNRASLRPSIYADHPTMAANVTCTTFTNIPMTVGEQRQVLAMLLELGALDPVQDRRAIAEVFGLNDIRSVLDRGRAGRDKNELKVTRWKMGQPAMPVARTDDHESAIEIIGNFIASDEFAKISVENVPLAEQVLEQYADHEQFFFDLQAEREMRALMARVRAAGRLYREAQVDQMPPAVVQYFGALANGMALMGPQPEQPQGSSQKPQTSEQKQEKRRAGAAKQSQNRGDGAAAERPVGAMI